MIEPSVISLMLMCTSVVLWREKATHEMKDLQAVANLKLIVLCIKFKNKKNDFVEDSHALVPFKKKQVI